MSSRIKRKSENGLFTRPNKLIRQELRTIKNNIKPVYSDLKLRRKYIDNKHKKV